MIIHLNTKKLNYLASNMWNYSYIFYIISETQPTNLRNKLIDINTLTFVALHELSHIMTESIGHKQEFWTNFKFMLKHAVKEGIYEPIDYSKSPEDYCGLMIDDNPLF
jgi:hypothetical protein